MTLRGSSFGLAAFLAAAAAATVALAHTPYLLPTTFAVSKDHVTLQAAMTEDEYFVPDFAMRGGEYHLVAPSGAQAKIETVIAFKDFVVVEAPLPEPGTYKITTGERAGRTAKMAKVDGQWRMVRPAGARPRGNAPARPARDDGEAQPRVVDEAALPAGAEIVEVQLIMKCEAYVTKGAPSGDGALRTTGKGFEVRPLSHPNEIYLDEGVSFEMTIDGAPASDLRLTVYRGGNSYDDRKVHAEAKTDAQGRVALGFDRPGVYLLATHYPARGRQRETPATRSYTYTLTFEVLQ